MIKREISDIKCIIIGDGPEKGKLMKLAKKLRVENNVKFVGFLENHDDVIAYMKSSKVFVLPSTREGFGIVALEANACGLPVVTVIHERNAVCDFIKSNGNGFICELLEEEIADEILMALDRREDMRERCIKNAKEYDWERITNLVERLYDETSR